MDHDSEGGADDTILPYRVRRPNLPHTAQRSTTKAAPRAGIAPWMYLVPAAVLLLGGLGFVFLQGRAPATAPQAVASTPAVPAPVPATKTSPTPSNPQAAGSLATPSPATSSPASPTTSPTATAANAVASPTTPAAYLPFAREQDILSNRSVSLSMFRLAENPAILVLDFPSMRDQARMLNRVAVLVETRGQPRDRVLGDDALEKAIRSTGAEPDNFYDGHDYRANDLVRVFALADRDGIRLNPDEVRLRDLLRTLGWTDAGAVGALISIPTLGAGIDSAARTSILRHEISHGQFFTDPNYAAFTQRFWQTELTEAERTAFRRFLSDQQYDATDETLMMNEMQAYLVHTHDPRFFSPDLVKIPADRIATLRRRFIAGMPPGWFHDMTVHDQHL